MNEHWAEMLTMIETELERRGMHDWYRIEYDGDLLHIWPEER